MIDVDKLPGVDRVGDRGGRGDTEHLGQRERVCALDEGFLELAVNTPDRAIEIVRALICGPPRSISRTNPCDVVLPAQDLVEAARG